MQLIYSGLTIGSAFRVGEMSIYMYSFIYIQKEHCNVYVSGYICILIGEDIHTYIRRVTRTIHIYTVGMHT